jgi:hypothetical protein
MSARASSDARRASDWPTRFARWRGLLSLSLGVLLGPVVALANQQATYSVDAWACGHDTRAVLHVAPALCLILVLALTWSAYANWRAVGPSPDDEYEFVGARTRFLAMLGVTISVFSAVVILAQWAAVFVFDPCVR